MMSTVVLPAGFDWKNPDYVSVFQHRLERLRRIRSDPSCLPALKAYYKENPAQFLIDWAQTVDPRNVERGLPAAIPFILFPRQVEWVDWVLQNWRDQVPGVTEKSRDAGMSWLSVGLACTMCLHHQGMAIGFGSRKEEYVDRIGSPKSLFFKARMLMSSLPPEFRGGWNLKHDAPFLRLNFPDTGANISGEAGDNIGRGDRTSMYFVDEAAYVERPALVEASLSATTNCRQDISSANGMGNPFAQKRFGGKVRVFTLHWRDDPRRDQAWYLKKCSELDPVTIASELDIDYSASVEGVLIPSAWVQSAVDAHLKLGIEPTGERSAALDVADLGVDTNAFCGAHGVVVDQLEEWSGANSDIYRTAQRAFTLCDAGGYASLKYDADGLGSAIRGDARVLNEGRAQALTVTAYRGSAAVFDPERQDVKGRLNKDFFLNCKAQAWWRVRTRFQNTYKAVVEGMEYDRDAIISIPSALPLRSQLVGELSQPTYSINGTGKIVVDKTPDGTRSPNLADALVMRFAQSSRPPIKISNEALRRFGARVPVRA